MLNEFAARVVRNPDGETSAPTAQLPPPKDPFVNLPPPPGTPQFTAVGQSVGPFELPVGMKPEDLARFHLEISPESRRISVTDVGPERWATDFHCDDNTARVRMNYDEERGVMTMIAWDRRDEEGRVRGNVIEVVYDKETMKPATVRAVEDFVREPDGTFRVQTLNQIGVNTPQSVKDEYQEHKAQIDALKPLETYETTWRTWSRTNLGHLYYSIVTLSNTYGRLDDPRFFTIDDNAEFRPKTKLDSFSNGFRRGARGY